VPLNVEDCRISSWATVQNDSALEVLPSRSTAFALATMAMVGAIMNLQNNSLPQAYKNLDTYVTELLIRSYAASWTAIGYMSNSSLLSTGARVAIPTSRARYNVIPFAMTVAHEYLHSSPSLSSLDNVRIYFSCPCQHPRNSSRE
jgi:hypothetical protein